MPFQYPRSVWRGISIRLRQGESVVSISAETGICQGTLYRWKHQALVDAGIKEGTPSPDASDLVSARKRIRQLEEELAIVKAASALFDQTEVVRPKGKPQSSPGSSPKDSPPAGPASA
ncbi:transposase [Arthrobacter sp. ATA002]|uniref:transposase n=1 Tax=Arthrobacter sp. ATA002 TaxID=2991715 RepID=UPI0022A7EB0E|nr:transposase [Arthrobacter sp. ATA002]WAP52913.1 transposase [Arthrobacter sp. ATA002]